VASWGVSGAFHGACAGLSPVDIARCRTEEPGSGESFLAFAFASVSFLFLPHDVYRGDLEERNDAPERALPLGPGSLAYPWLFGSSGRTESSSSKLAMTV
jgi:hypothetical protein